MEILIFIILTIILLESTLLLAKSSKKLNLTQKPKRKVYVDTSALMDGRILAVAQTGFIGDDIIIPRSVTRELQLLADGKDAEKRSRARYGLDVLNELERVVHFDVTIFEDELDRTPVDDRLIELAKHNHGAIVTVDFNLNKVATAEGIDVLNVNDLALVLRSEYHSGERAELKITSRGSNPGQGVGHLPDGTMVVVDNADDKIDQTITVEFVRFIQTSAGRMMFAKLVNHKKSKSHRQSTRRKS